MTFKSSFSATRRDFLLGGAATLGVVAAGGLSTASAIGRAGASENAGGAVNMLLRPGAAQASLVANPAYQTAVWAYNGIVPGPEIRVRQGQRLHARLENALVQETTIHWHGIRVPNAMDGVPGLTQAAVKPGDSFDYVFDLPDAGTYWYHPHANTTEQLGRGLYGALIVEEADPLPVDRELVWMRDDWRLNESAAIDDGFNAMHDVGHAGRIGNVVTVNGVAPMGTVGDVPVRPGERIRLRLLNAANGRIFALDFDELAPMVIAMDGHPVTPHRNETPLLLLGPGMRFDLVIDIPVSGKPSFAVTDRFYDGMENAIARLVPSGTPLRDHAPDGDLALKPNSLPEPDLGQAVKHDLIYSGGMMGDMILSQMIRSGHITPEKLSAMGMESAAGSGMGGMANMMRSMFGAGNIWAVNGRDPDRDGNGPLVTLTRGQTCHLTLMNATAWLHPIHLHGHAFRLLARNDVPVRHQPWLDTVLIEPGDRVEIAFVADNPGDWLIHCHILEHKVGGMSGVIRVL